MTRLYAMKVITEVEIDMVVAADSEGEALGVAKRFAKKEASFLSMDIWQDCDADVEREIRSLDDLPEGFDVDCVAWDKNGMIQADLDDLIARIPDEPEGGSRAKAKADLRDRLFQAKAALDRAKPKSESTPGGQPPAAGPPAGGGL